LHILPTLGTVCPVCHSRGDATCLSPSPSVLRSLRPSTHLSPVPSDPIQGSTRSSRDEPLGLQLRSRRRSSPVFGGASGGCGTRFCAGPRTFVPNTVRQPDHRRLGFAVTGSPCLGVADESAVPQNRAEISVLVPLAQERMQLPHGTYVEEPPPDGDRSTIYMPSPKQNSCLICYWTPSIMPNDT
jgi:hypothetical protein